MSATAQVLIDGAAEAAGRLAVRTLRRVAVSLVSLAAVFFYVVGRVLLKLVRAPRSETGVPEAVVGVLIVSGFVAALIKLPLRLALASLMR